MTTPQDVIAAALDMTSGSRLERARAGMRALGLFGQLSSEEKRDLAVLVAQRVAPELVPRIRAEGALDLTEQQSRAVLDMVRRLDADDLRELQDAVATPDARQQALASVGAAAAEAAGLDDVVAEPETDDGDTPTPPPAVPDEQAQRTQARIEALERQLADLRDQLTDAQQAQREAADAVEQAERDRDEAEEEARAERDRADEEARAAAQARTDLRTLRDRFRRFRDRATETTTSTGPASTDPALASGLAPVVPVTTTAEQAERLVARLDERGAGHALRQVVAAAASIAGMSATSRRRTLLAVPDGWARQRALQRLVEAEAVPANEAPDLLATLSSPGGQLFAANSMLATGLVGIDDLVGAMHPSAAARLQRRARPVKAIRL